MRLVPIAIMALAGACGDAKRVFLTNTGYTGDLGGLAGADEKCDNSAAAGGLGGTWRAWLSDSTTNAIDRFDDVGPWERVDGETAFNNKANLTTSPIVPLDVNEHGVQLTGPPAVWTATSVGGTLDLEFSGTCGDWTRSDTSTGAYGLANATNGQWTDSNSTQLCYVPVQLYCIEQ